MHRVVSELRNQQNIFVGDYDSYTIISQKVSLENLLLVTKLALLLYDHILMPAAFFWQSEELQHLMVYLEEPIARGNILPVIRNYNSTTDIYDYFERRVDESQKIGRLEVFKQPELASEIACADHIKCVKQLERINTYAHLEEASVRDIFISNWISDLDNHTDINSIRLLLCQSQLSDDKRTEIIELLSKEAHYPQFSRASCIERVQSMIPHGNIQELIKNRISWLYLKSNAESYNSKFFYTFDPYNKMLFEENLLLLAKTLDVLGITKDLILSLPISDIIYIRNSPEFHQFISAYRKLVNASYCKQNDIVAKLRQRLTWEMKKEHFASSIYKKINFVQFFSGSIFINLISNHFSGSDINTPLFIASGLTSTISYFLKQMALLNRNMNAGPFSGFKEYIIAEQYKEYFRTHLGE